MRTDTVVIVVLFVAKIEEVMLYNIVMKISTGTVTGEIYLVNWTI